MQPLTPPGRFTSSAAIAAIAAIAAAASHRKVIWLEKHGAIWYVHPDIP
jgi:hypothetical protein